MFYLPYMDVYFNLPIPKIILLFVYIYKKSVFYLYTYIYIFWD